MAQVGCSLLSIFPYSKCSFEAMTQRCPPRVFHGSKPTSIPWQQRGPPGSLDDVKVEVNEEYSDSQERTSSKGEEPEEPIVELTAEEVFELKRIKGRLNSARLMVSGWVSRLQPQNYSDDFTTVFIDDDLEKTSKDANALEGEMRMLLWMLDDATPDNPYVRARRKVYLIACEKFEAIENRYSQMACIANRIIPPIISQISPLKRKERDD